MLSKKKKKMYIYIYIYIYMSEPNYKIRPVSLDPNHEPNKAQARLSKLQSEFSPPSVPSTCSNTITLATGDGSAPAIRPVARQQRPEDQFRINFPKHLPLHSYCLHNKNHSSSKPCIIDGATGDICTFADVELNARRVASGLNKLGIQQGDVIMLLLPNSPAFAFAFLGASFRGAMTTAANPFFTPAEILKQAKASKAKLIITLACYCDKVKDLSSSSDDVHDIKLMCVDSPPDPSCLHFSELLQADEKDMPEVDISPDDVVALPYSSETTGLPKGVMLTHKGLVTSVAQQVDGENPNLYYNTDIVISFTLAGRDTTSAALTWFFWLLSQNPCVENEILRQINEAASSELAAGGVLRRGEGDGVHPRGAVREHEAVPAGSHRQQTSDKRRRFAGRHQGLF
ncbi:hypothetical protein ACFX1R_027177 [Malus domestica]